MQFEKLKNHTEIWNSFIADAKNFNFEDTEQALDDFQKYLNNLNDLRNTTAQEIFEQALLLASTIEQQGFYHGFSKGVNLAYEAKEMNERIS